MGWAARAHKTPGIKPQGTSYRSKLGAPLDFFDAKGERIYFWGLGGTVRHMIRKVRGKSARRADKKARRLERQAA